MPQSRITIAAFAGRARCENRRRLAAFWFHNAQMRDKTSSSRRGEDMAAHEGPRTTKLYDRTSDEITLEEVERIVI